MKNHSMLATVRAAASMADDFAAPLSQSQSQEDDMAATKKGEGGAPAAPDTTAKAAPAVTAESIRADHPDFCNALRAEGATAERERILGIEAVALPGHETLVSEMKADPAVSPDAAAARIVQAEKQIRAAQAQGVRDVEKLTGGVPAAASASGPTDPAAALAAKPDSEKTEEDFKAEYAAGPADINKSVTSEADYISLRKAEVSGRVKVLRKA